jgi:hypothetical protein
MFLPASLLQSATDFSDSSVTNARAMDLSLQLAVCFSFEMLQTSEADCRDWTKNSVARWTAGPTIGQYTAFGLSQSLQGDHE